MSVISNVAPTVGLSPGPSQNPQDADDDASQTQEAASPSDSSQAASSAGEPAPADEPPASQAQTSAGPSELGAPSRADRESVVLSLAVSEAGGPDRSAVASDEATARRLAEATVERLRIERLVDALTQTQDVLTVSQAASDQTDGANGTELTSPEPAAQAEAQRFNRSA